MSPGFIERPLGRFSVAPTTPITRTGSASRAIALDRLDHGRAARHVVLHLLHAVARLDRDAAAVEGDRLADEAECRAARARAVVAQRDQRGLLVAALRDRRERAHAARLDLVPAVDLDADCVELRRQLERALAKIARGHVVGRGVLERARAFTASATICARASVGVDVACGVADVSSSSPAGARAPRGRRARLVTVEAVAGEDRALDQRRRDVAAGAVGQLPAQRLRAEFAGSLRGLCGGDARDLGREVPRACRGPRAASVARLVVGQRERAALTLGLTRVEQQLRAPDTRRARPRRPLRRACRLPSRRAARWWQWPSCGPSIACPAAPPSACGDARVDL